MRFVTGIACGGAVVVACALAACGAEEMPSWNTTEAGNSPPVIDWLQIDPADPGPGDTVTARVRARDPEGDSMEFSYTWEVGGVPRMETGPKLSLEGVAKGTDVSVVAVASDGVNSSEAARSEVRIRNRRPTLVQAKIVPWESVARGEKLVIEPVANDPDGDPVDFTYEWHVNDEPVEGAGSEFATDGLAPGDVVLARVRATDGESESDPIDTARVRVTGAVPRIVSSPTGLSADGAFHYQLEVEYLGGSGDLRYALRKGPAGMNVNAATGEVSWRPSPSQHGDHEVEVEVADSRGTKSVQAFRITVGSGAAPPARPAP